MGKYQALGKYLEGLDMDRVTLSFSRVSSIVGGLPPSAFEWRPWWSNANHVQAVAWQGAGWRVADVDLMRAVVTFARNGSVSSPEVGERRTRNVSGAEVTTRGAPTINPTEEATQAAVARYLTGQGWDLLRLADTATREHGIDILARRHGVHLAIEVKGYPSTEYADPRRAGERKPTPPASQARQWYSHAVLKALLTRDEHPDYRVAMAFPEAVTFRNLVTRTQGSLSDLGISVFFVAETGAVRVWPEPA
jgi:hypothetical protein